MKIVWVSFVLALAMLPRAAFSQEYVQVEGDSVMLRFVDVQMRTVFQAMGRYLDRPLLVGEVPDRRITFETPTPVGRSTLTSLMAGMASTYDLEFVQDSGFFQLRSRSQAFGRGESSTEATARTPVELFVLNLRHARALDVAVTLGNLFGNGVRLRTQNAETGTLADELQRAEETRSSERDSLNGADGLRGPVTIVADDRTNALLVMSDSTSFRVIENTIRRLDVRPLQVLIEVLIVEARKDRLFALGVEGSIENVPLMEGGTLAGTMQSGVGLGDLVIQIMNFTEFNVEGVIRAAVSRGDARIHSRPIILASNNREARILVGSQRPFIEISRTLPTDSPVRDQVVQYRDVGTQLFVTPTINVDGFVSLEIRQEVNSATGETQFNAPVIATREIETQLLVRDRQTVVLGGLRERQTEVVKTGLPILSSLPIIGGLFGSQERRTTETDLFIFITPRVITDDQTADSVTTQAMNAADESGIKHKN